LEIRDSWRRPYDISEHLPNEHENIFPKRLPLSKKQLCSEWRGIGAVTPFSKRQMTKPIRFARTTRWAFAIWPMCSLIENDSVNALYQKAMNGYGKTLTP
jgi:hypothetical protein